MKKLNFYNVNNQYIDYLKKFESKIPNINYENHKKFCCGILFEINGMKYIAPVSSFKKAQKTNFVIKNTNRQDISSIRFSFMFPIYDELISIKNFSNEDKL